MTFLIGNTNISTTEIYPHVAPLGRPLPAVTVSLDSAQRTRAFDGPVQIREADFQVDAWSKTQAQATDLAREIIGEIENYRGDMAGIYVKRIDIEGEDTGFDRATELYRHSLFFTAWHS
ncbi:MAG: DUF3168 domain-containing protein [Candidatus Reddybacter sp.]